MSRFSKLGVPGVVLAALAGCSPDYSPNTYATNAVQQANKVEPGIVVGFREVAITADGTVGAVAGGAAGGILGAAAGAPGIDSALGGVGGSLVGSFIGSSVAHASGDTTGWEYIVRKSNNELLSVTQREPEPLPLGQKVLVITGNQARIVADYSVQIDMPSTDKDKDKDKDADKPKAEKADKADKAKAESPPPADKAANDGSDAPAAAGVSAASSASVPKPDAPPATPPPPSDDSGAKPAAAAPTPLAPLMSMPLGETGTGLPYSAAASAAAQAILATGSPGTVGTEDQPNPGP